jgi:hypothetical protein
MADLQPLRKVPAPQMSPDFAEFFIKKIITRKFTILDKI